MCRIWRIVRFSRETPLTTRGIFTIVVISNNYQTIFSVKLKIIWKIIAYQCLIRWIGSNCGNLRWIFIWIKYTKKYIISNCIFKIRITAIPAQI